MLFKDHQLPQIRPQLFPSPQTIHARRTSSNRSKRSIRSPLILEQTPLQKLLHHRRSLHQYDEIHPRMHPMSVYFYNLRTLTRNTSTSHSSSTKMCIKETSILPVHTLEHQEKESVHLPRTRKVDPRGNGKKN